MKLIIAGSRSITNYKVFTRTIQQSQLIDKASLIICGGASGVDSLGLRYAIENKIHCRIVIPEWGKYGKTAGPIRNQYMLEQADGLICLWDGQSRGTFDMFNRWISQKEYPCEIFFIHQKPYKSSDPFFDR